MGQVVAVLVIIIAICTAYWITYIYQQMNQNTEIPPFNLQKWWGAGVGPAKEDTSIRSFKIEFNDTVNNNGYS